MLSSFLSLLLSLFFDPSSSISFVVLYKGKIFSLRAERERERDSFFIFPSKKKGDRKGGDKSPSMRFTEPKITDGTEMRGLCVQR